MVMSSSCSLYGVYAVPVALSIIVNCVLPILRPVCGSYLPSKAGVSSNSLVLKRVSSKSSTDTEPAPLETLESSTLNTLVVILLLVETVERFTGGPVMITVVFLTG